jgi:Uma2 family endonuclease
MDERHDMKPAAIPKLTYDDFLSLPDDGQRHELIGGDHYVTPSPVTRHQRISGELFFSLRGYLGAKGSGSVFTAPFDVLLSDHDVVEPDLLVILADQSDILTAQHVRGAPAIVVEILSPGTRRRDETLKRALYERAGVREYWTIDPDQNVVTLYRFESPDAATVALHRGTGEMVTSPLLPEWKIAVDELLA